MQYLFLVAFVVLLLVWIGSWLVWHIASGLIHLLLIVAIIALIAHLLRGGR